MLMVELFKKLFILSFLIGFCFIQTSVFGAVSSTTILPAQVAPISQAPMPSAVVPQQIGYEYCNKIFKIDGHKLFYLTLAGLNANRFAINEIQSKSGYVLFSVAQRQFLASVVNIDTKTSMLKITPCNNIYYFPIGIVQNMFKYIELNLNTPVEKLELLQL